MADKTYVLRDLPGVREMEAEANRYWEDKNRAWSPEFDGLQERKDILCRRLFGVTAEEAGEVDYVEDEPAHRYWNRVSERREMFDFLYEDGALDDLAEMGWDVLNEDGEPLLCLGWLERSLVVATKGIKGRLPDAPPTEAEIQKSVERFEDKMAAEAEAFRRKRRGK